MIYGKPFQSDIFKLEIKACPMYLSLTMVSE